MKKISAVIVTAAALALGLPVAPRLAWAVDFSPSGKIQGFAGVGLGFDKKNAGDFLLGNLRLDGSLKMYEDDCSAFIDGFLMGDAIGSQSSFQAADFVSDNGAFRLRLKEAWMDYDGGFWALRIGRQSTAWGKADGLQVADVLCAKDENTILAREYADSRLSVDAARLTFKNDAFVFDAYWIPFFAPSALPLAEKNPLKRVMIPKSANMGGTAIPIAQVTKSNFDLPGLSLENSEFAARLAAFFPFADFSLYGFYGFDREPCLTYSLLLDGGGNPQALSVNGSYKRMLMIGADAAIPIKEVVLRLEAAVFPRRTFAASSKEQLMGAEKFRDKNQLVALAGFDWTPSGWTITGQYYLDALLDGSSHLDRDSYRHQTSLSVSKAFFQETLDLSLAWLFGLNDFDSMIKVQAKYSLTDSMALSLGSDLFINGPDKDKKGFYGAYQELSAIWLKAEYNF
jgi:hypothetical protein